jgi:hypothetical protein
MIPLSRIPDTNGKAENQTVLCYLCPKLNQYGVYAMGWTTMVQFPARQDFSLHHNVQTSSKANPIFYPMETAQATCNSTFFGV